MANTLARLAQAARPSVAARFRALKKWVMTRMPSSPTDFHRFSSGNVGQDAILSHRFSSLLLQYVGQDAILSHRFSSLLLQYVGQDAILSHRFSSLLLRKRGTRCHLVPPIFIASPVSSANP